MANAKSNSGIPWLQLKSEVALLPSSNLTRAEIHLSVTLSPQQNKQAFAEAFKQRSQLMTNTL